MSQRRHPDEPTIAWDAPVVSTAELEIDAPIDKVWAVLTAIEEWPSWNPDVKSVTFDGPFQAGATFRWRAGPGTITSHIEHVDSPRMAAWSGKTLGIRAVHVWRLTAQGGKTVVRSEESYGGVVARILRRPLRKTLDAALTDGAAHLKEEAERSGPVPA